MCVCGMIRYGVFFFKQKTAYEMRISDWSSDVCSSDLVRGAAFGGDRAGTGQRTDQQAAAGAFGRRDQRGAVGSHIGRRIDIARLRSEERRVGKECVSTSRSWWSP